ncbi:PucR family transcriptional regulator [Mesobacillus harenae]|uniref:PucR family transcriptional regulator n=1 Tax=Mesobacillus harenae TaxID=2213203 RepID=UPI0015802B0D|nr:helix-turn-helix domain-containing protein [Mesobacillus harenae]
MINKLKIMFSNAIITEDLTEKHIAGFYWFKDNKAQTWIGIPQTDLEPGQVELLQTLFDHYQLPSSKMYGKASDWYNFLIQGKGLPGSENKIVRFIHFRYEKNELNQREIAEAFKNLFPDHCHVIWLEENKGVIVEEQKDPLITEEDLLSIAAAFEGDFFTQITFLLGKYRKTSETLRKAFQSEQTVFSKGLRLFSRERLLTFEKIFPAWLNVNIPDEMKEIVSRDILEHIREDKELTLTLKVFLENNSNASLASKKLYIHRNTLQYRLDKFMEKTGINLKDFNGAITVYLSCLLLELD